MKTRALTVLLLALVATGCRENLGSVAPFGVCGFPDDAEACEMEPTCARYLADRPGVFLIDSLGFDNELLLWIQWNNQMPDNSDATTGRTNTNTFYIEEYEIAFTTTARTAADAVPPLAAITIPTVTVPALAPPVPTEGSTVSQVSVIPVEIGQYLQALLPDSGPAIVIAEVKAIGRLGDDSRFESGTIKIPVEVYNAQFPGWGCPKDGEFVTAICPNDGQTASVACEAP